MLVEPCVIFVLTLFEVCYSYRSDVGGHYRDSSCLWTLYTYIQIHIQTYYIVQRLPDIVILFRVKTMFS